MRYYKNGNQYAQFENESYNVDFQGVEITKEEYDLATTVEYTEDSDIPKLTYEQLVQSKIARKYSIADEIAILRQIDQKPREFATYYNYCEDCKREARAELNI